MKKDLQHNLILRSFGDRLGTAPPNEPGSKVGRVLDLGTGSGIWAIDFGDEHPEADVSRKLGHLPTFLHAHHIPGDWRRPICLPARIVRISQLLRKVTNVHESDTNKYLSAPPNVRFEIDDVDETWTYSVPFDYIHSRMMTSSIANWDEYIRKAYELVFNGSIHTVNFCLIRKL